MITLTLTAWDDWIFVSFQEYDEHLTEASWSLYHIAPKHKPREPYCQSRVVREEERRTGRSITPKECCPACYGLVQKALADGTLRKAEERKKRNNGKHPTA